MKEEQILQDEPENPKDNIKFDSTVTPEQKNMVGAMVEEIWTSCGGEKSQNGKLSKEEMADFLALITGKSQLTQAQLDEGFASFDQNAKGYVSKNDVIAYVSRIYFDPEFEKE